ncbi:DUF2946 family protein [Azospirillum sp. TSO35-2]|uniref:DUF2946 family protein n=1 Tax=Azospirillum sp. TSO35-2 TaxID=716796 RepID=UPI001FFE70AC|nr:DUF2946 family protein [Azospirillum sp. TSO35-2]
MVFSRVTMRRVRRLGLMAGVAALLLQVIAWGWMPSIVGTARAGDDSTVLICSVDGLKSVILDAQDDGAGDAAAPSGTPSKPSPYGTGHCPLCPLMSGLALPPPPTSIGPTLAEARDSRPLPGERIAAGWFLSTLQARAPPALG